MTEIPKYLLSLKFHYFLSLCFFLGGCFSRLARGHQICRISECPSPSPGIDTGSFQNMARSPKRSCLWWHDQLWLRKMRCIRFYMFGFIICMTLDDCVGNFSSPLRRQLERNLRGSYFTGFYPFVGTFSNSDLLYIKPSVTSRDGVSEGQFYQVLLYELDAIRKVNLV